MLEVNNIDFLNFFYPINIKLYDIEYKSAGHFYFASKVNLLNYTKEIAQSENPEKYTKELLIKCPDLLRFDWNDVRLSILSFSIYTKFLDNELQKKLICTGKEELIYNISNLKNPSDDDLFLGKDLNNNVGENNLGVEIMKQREIFQVLNKHCSLNQSYRSTEPDTEWTPTLISECINRGAEVIDNTPELKQALEDGIKLLKES